MTGRGEKNVAAQLLKLAAVNVATVEPFVLGHKNIVTETTNMDQMNTSHHRNVIQRYKVSGLDK